jgi:hypothetical protein
VNPRPFGIVVTLAALAAAAATWRGELPHALSTQGLTYRAEGTKDAASRCFKRLSGELESLRGRVERLEKEA